MWCSHEHNLANIDTFRTQEIHEKENIKIDQKVEICYNLKICVTSKFIFTKRIMNSTMTLFIGLNIEIQLVF